jgi:hypothetical protein
VLVLLFEFGYLRERIHRAVDEDSGIALGLELSE